MILHALRACPTVTLLKISVATFLNAQFVCYAQVVIFQSEDGFLADLGEPTDFGSIEDPTKGRDIANLSEFIVSQTINEKTYSFEFREGEFNSHGLSTTNIPASSPNKYVFPPSADAIDTSQSGFLIEAGVESGGNGTQQGGGSIPEWGIDTAAPITALQVSPNTVALFDFTNSPTPVSSFSLKAIDFEGGNSWSNGVAAYRLDGSRIGATNFDFPAPTYGDGSVHFVGFGAEEPMGYVAFIVGEDDDLGVGGSERIAIGDFRTGQSPLMSVPEPSGRLGLTYLFAACLILRQTRKAGRSLS